MGKETSLGTACISEARELWGFEGAFLVMDWSHLQGITLVTQGEDCVPPFCRCHKN